MPGAFVWQYIFHDWNTKIRMFRNKIQTEVSNKEMLYMFLKMIYLQCQETVLIILLVLVH